MIVYTAGTYRLFRIEDKVAVCVGVGRLLPLRDSMPLFITGLIPSLLKLWFGLVVHWRSYLNKTFVHAILKILPFFPQRWLLKQLKKLFDLPSLLEFRLIKFVIRFQASCSRPGISLSLFQTSLPGQILLNCIFMLCWEMIAGFDIHYRIINIVNESSHG